MKSPTGSLILFYALWPDEDIRSQLVALQSKVSGRKIVPENLHMTLAFLGQQSRELLPVLHRAMDELPFNTMTLAIDRLGYFQKPQVAWAGLSSASQGLLDLQRTLMEKLAYLDVPLKAETGFKPHITLARDAKEPTVTDTPSIFWHVRRIVLISSISTSSGVSYMPLRERNVQ